MGRPLSPGLSSTLLAIHDDYGLPVDVTLMLLQFVKSKGKDNTSYIEAVARDWAEEGISTHPHAAEKRKKTGTGKEKRSQGSGNNGSA